MWYDITANRILTEVPKIAQIWVIYNEKSTLHSEHCISHHNSEERCTK